MPSEDRPAIKTVTDSAELRRWYWTRAELADAAAHHGLVRSGAKFDLLDRIAHFLETGEAPARRRQSTTSRFDWHSAPLSPETEITDNYRNTQNVRRFFHAHLGPDFKFSIAFMDWMKANTGKTLADAIKAHGALTRAPIKPHNQFNQYIRDILADNPGMPMDEVRRIWSLKRALPSKTGRHVYEQSDLDLGDPRPKSR